MKIEILGTGYAKIILYHRLLAVRLYDLIL